MWNYISQKALSRSTACRNRRRPSDLPLDMAFLARCFGCQACRSVALLNGRYLQSRMGLPDAWPLLSLQQALSRAQKLVSAHQRHAQAQARLGPPAEHACRRMLKGHKSLSH